MKVAILIICLAASMSVAAEDHGYKYQYLGCYKDTEQRDLNEKQWQDGRMTQGRCIDFCGENGFAYAGAQYGGQCFCGNVYGRYGKIAENNCNMPCNGDPGHHCGGTWANSVFKISNSPTPSNERHIPTEGAASGSAGAITANATVEVEDSNGPVKLKVEEKIAIMFLTAIQNIERDCQMRAKHACNMDQLLTGPIADGARLAHLKFDPATDPNYTYTLSASGMAWEVHANAKKPGLMGFYFLSKSFPGSADATYNPAGTASAIDKSLTGRTVYGDSFEVR